MGKRKIVLIGNGMAGVRCIEEILKLDRSSFEITIFGSEPHPNYNRILLSKVLQGDTTIDDITINDWQWYKENQIKLYTGETVVKIDTGHKQVITDIGRIAEYDELILATGSLPFMLPLPGANKQGVTAFRDIRDCQKMVEASKNYKKAVVIGGGLLGLEAARGLLNLNMAVDVVHIFGNIMERQLDPTAAKMLQKELENQGMRFLLEKQTEEIMGRSRAIGLRFKDGTRTDADLVVMAVGVRPNVQLAKDSDIATNRAIVVNDYMQTNIPHVYAVGECAEHRGVVYGLVAPLYEQGKILAHHICGVESEGYQGSVLATQLKVSGVDVFSAGEFMDTDETKSLKMYDGIRNTYKKVTVRDNKIVGAVLFGDISEGTKLLGMIKQQADISVWEKELYGSRSGGHETGEELIASMPEKELVCACNGVTKGTIMQAIQEQGLETLDEIKKCTKASSSCGSCKPIVHAILEYTQRYGFENEAEKETVCGCTTLSHEEVVEEIRSRHFSNAKGLMNVLGWSKQDGCDICRPAVQYYLGVHGSGLVEGFSAEEASNIQADGTYAIAPRIYGGVTGARQLRKIADVVEKYRVPMVKLSNRSRLELLGIKQEDVSSVRAELEMPETGPIYGAGLDTVETCTGLQYAYDAMQDSIRLGIALEKKLERLQTPYEVTVSVSASPHHEAGSLIKDIGIAGAPGGWEFYIAGSGTSQIRQGQLLCTAVTDEELLNLVYAFLQYYRETARYAERTWQWVERMGLVQLREALFDKELQQVLVMRLEAAVSSNAAFPARVNQQPTAAVTR